MPLIKDFARLQIAALKIDTADFTEVQNRLNDLIGDKNPWRYTARELLGLAAIRAGKLDEARKTLAPLSADPRAPAAVRERAGALMNMVVAAELEKSAPAKVEIEKTDDPPAQGRRAARQDRSRRAPRRRRKAAAGSRGEEVGRSIVGRGSHSRRCERGPASARSPDGQAWPSARRGSAHSLAAAGWSCRLLRQLQPAEDERSQSVR